MRNLMACVTFAILLTASAQNIGGTWQGQLDLGIARLNIEVNIAPDGTCTIDSPDQGARGIPAKVVFVTADTLKFKSSTIGAECEGKLPDGSSSRIFSNRGDTRRGCS